MAKGKRPTSPPSRAARPIAHTATPLMYLSTAYPAAARFCSARLSGARKFAWHFGQRIRCPSSFASSTVKKPQKGQEIGPRVATAFRGGGLGRSSLVQIDSFSLDLRRRGVDSSSPSTVSDVGIASTKRCPHGQRISFPAISSRATSEREQLGHETVSNQIFLQLDTHSGCATCLLNSRLE
jgi:hypothetical protein